MDFYNERQVKKTKKEHKCLGCLEKIPTGSACSYSAWVNEGDFGDAYLCFKCRDYLDKNPEFAREGFSEGDIRDAMIEDEEWRKERGKIL